MLQCLVAAEAKSKIAVTLRDGITEEQELVVYERRWLGEIGLIEGRVLVLLY